MIALASLQVARSARVTDQSGVTKHESIATTSRGFAVYELTADSSRHPECTQASGCFTVWPPVTVSSAKALSKATGVNGKLGVWHRNGFVQVTLGGHPLYRFAHDTQRHVATGEGIHGFGGTATGGRRVGAAYPRASLGYARAASACGVRPR